MQHLAEELQQLVIALTDWVGERDSDLVRGDLGHRLGPRLVLDVYRDLNHPRSRLLDARRHRRLPALSCGVAKVERGKGAVDEVQVLPLRLALVAHRQVAHQVPVLLLQLAPLTFDQLRLHLRLGLQPHGVLLRVEHASPIGPPLGKFSQLRIGYQDRVAAVLAVIHGDDVFVSLRRILGRVRLGAALRHLCRGGVSRVLPKWPNNPKKFFWVVSALFPNCVS